MKKIRKMKNKKSQHLKLSALLVLFAILFACNNNRLKSNEKTLAKQILTEEEQLAHEQSLREEREKQLMDSIAKLPKGFRFKEERSINPQNPPIVIDIIGNRSNPQKIELSQLFSKVEYIRLEQSQDSTEFIRGEHFIVAPNHIYVASGKGSIFQYDKNGHFIKTVVKGNLQFTVYNNGTMVTKEQADLFEGAQHVYWNGNKLCYLYENRPAQKSYLMTFDDNAGPEISNLQMPGSVEDKNRINGSGEILSEIKKNPDTYSFPTPFLVGNTTLAFTQRRKPVGNPANFVNVISTTGDTLCEFKDHDPIKNFSKSIVRIVDDGTSYYRNEILHIRQSFNDTIYQLVPPNRLVPKYILDFGDFGIKSANQGIDPGFGLEDKLLIQSFLESNHYLFITYSKDHDNPANAKSGTLKYSRLVYDKQKRQTIVIYIDEAAFVPKGRTTWPSAPNINIENDLDAMPFVWPEFISADGKPFSKISGEDLLKLNDADLPFKNITKSDQIIAIYH